jgi:hypothetical protein
MLRRCSIALLLAPAILGSCAPGLGRAQAVVALDEAFSAARPGLAERLEGLDPLGWGVKGLLSPPLVSRVALNEGGGKALDAAIAEEKKRGGPVALLASPLLAKAIVQGGTWSGDPPLVVPEWSGPELPGLSTARTDPLPAYRTAGAAAGAFIAELARLGGEPSCGILFSEAPSRPRAALSAFAEAYAEASEGRQLHVRELAEAGPELAEAATKELLGSDIRVLFVALGPSAGAALRAATRPGLALGADFYPPEWPPSLAFRIHPDEKALALALEAEARDLRGAEKGHSRLVPALVTAGAAARRLVAGTRDFGAFLEYAAAADASGGKNRP